MPCQTTHASPLRNIHYGWIILLVGFLVLFSCFGLARYAYAMLLPTMHAEEAG